MSNRQDHRFEPNKASKDSVKSWLQTALDGYLDDNWGIWAFEPLELEIGKEADLAGDLQRIYDSLKADGKSRWRLAVAELLAERGRDPRHRRAIGVLLDLSILMPAFEVLKVLPGIVADIGEGDDAWQLYDHAVAVAIELSRETQDARDCLERMRTSPGFSPTYAGLIFIALCRAEPEEWPRHMRAMRESLDALVHSLGPESDAPRWYAESFVHAVTLACLWQGRGAFFEHGDPSDNWLWNELFKGARSLLSRDESGYLFLRTDPSIRIYVGDDDRVEPAARPRKQEYPMLWADSFRDQPESVRTSAQEIEDRGWFLRNQPVAPGISSNQVAP